jgi:hypothetical protein
MKKAIQAMGEIPMWTPILHRPSKTTQGSVFAVPDDKYPDRQSTKDTERTRRLVHLGRTLAYVACVKKGGSTVVERNVPNGPTATVQE